MVNYVKIKVLLLNAILSILAIITLHLSTNKSLLQLILTILIITIHTMNLIILTTKTKRIRVDKNE